METNKFIEKYFLYLGLFFGLLFVFLTPPFQSPDEYNHFFRVAGISKGIFVPIKVQRNSVGEYYSNFLGADYSTSKFIVGSFLNKDLTTLAENISKDIPGKISHKQDVNVLLKFFSSSLNSSNEEIFVSYPNTALYSPIPYLPSLIGYVVGNIFKLNILQIMYLCRFASLIFYLFLIYCAIKISPKFKLPLFLLGLMPMSLYLGSMITADGPVIALSFLIFSLVNYLYNSYSKNFFIILCFVSFLLGMSKSAYFLIPLTSIVLWFSKENNVKYKSLLPFALSLFGLGIWSYLSKDLFIPLKTNIDSAGQISFITNNTFVYLKTFFITLIGNRRYIINQFVGNFGWLDTPLSLYVCYLYVFFIVLSVFGESSHSNKIFNTVNVFVGLISFFIVSTMLYISWSPVGHPEILGLNGKYLIPLSIFFVPVVSFKNRLNNSYYLNKVLLFVPIVTLIYSFVVIVNRFYLF